MTKKESEQIGDEINLFDFLQSIWKEKVLFLVITILISVISGGFALLSQNSLIYEASVNISPPSQSNVAELAKFNIIESSQSQPISQLKSEVFEEFLKVLRSNQLLDNFLAKKDVRESLFNKDKNLAENLINFEDKIKINSTNKDISVISFKLHDSDLASKFVDQIINFAILQYQNNISKRFTITKDSEIKKLEEQRKILISLHEESIYREITLLREAYDIAQKLNISEPLFLNQKNQSDVIGQLRYLYSQGEIALSLEIEALEKIFKNKSLVPGLTNLEERLKLLNSLSINAKKVIPLKTYSKAKAPFDQIDTNKKIKIQVDVTEIKGEPKRLLIVLISVILGSFFAILFILIRNAIRNRKLASMNKNS